MPVHLSGPPCTERRCSHKCTRSGYHRVRWRTFQCQIHLHGYYEPRQEIRLFRCARYNRRSCIARRFERCSGRGLALATGVVCRRASSSSCHRSPWLTEPCDACDRRPRNNRFCVCPLSAALGHAFADVFKQRLTMSLRSSAFARPALFWLVSQVVCGDRYCRFNPDKNWVQTLPSRMEFLFRLWILQIGIN